MTLFFPTTLHCYQSSSVCVLHSCHSNGLSRVQTASMRQTLNRSSYWAEWETNYSVIPLRGRQVNGKQTNSYQWAAGMPSTINRTRYSHHSDIALAQQHPQM